jgi:putative ABC transport system ATP-binding protein
VTDSGAPVLQARGLHRFYRRDGRVDAEVAALRDVDLSVHAGEMVAVVGPSGSGKSTLLGILAGLDEPDGGTVTIAGERMSHRTPAEQARLRGRQVGVMTQGSGLVDHLDVLGNVRLAASFRRGRRVTEREARTLLERLGLGSRSHARPATLSGGETARANLAAALVGSPSLLLADEPTAEVSRAEEAAILELLAEHRPAGSGAVLVTHSAAVARWADRVVELDAGRVVGAVRSAA